MDSNDVQLSCPPVDLCATCLSRSRSTRVLHGDSLRRMYRVLLSEENDEGVRACWECEALLRRCLRFARRAQQARATLQLHAADKIISLKCLSSLDVHKQVHYYHMQSDLKIKCEFIEQSPQDNNVASDEEPSNDVTKFEYDVIVPVPNIKEEADPLLAEVSVKHETNDTPVIEPNIDKATYFTPAVTVPVNKIQETKVPLSLCKPNPMITNEDILRNYQFSNILVQKDQIPGTMLKALSFIPHGTNVTVISKPGATTNEKVQRTPKINSSSNRTPLLQSKVSKVTEVTIGVSQGKVMPTNRPNSSRTLANSESPQPPVMREVTVSEVTMLERRQVARREPRYLGAAYKCDTCIIGYDNQEQFYDHRTTNHTPKDGTLKCSVCESYVPELVLSEHLANHRCMYMCSTCPYVHYDMRAAHAHACTCPPGPDTVQEWPCERCKKVFPSSKILHRHTVRTHQRRATCDACGKVLSTKSALVAHIKYVHSNESQKKKECSVCKKQFYKLGQHMKTHDATPPPRCEECNKTFKNESNLKFHMKYNRMHVKTDDLVKCTECDRRFVSKTLMKHHYMFAHLRTTDHVCRICNKFMSSSRALRRHVSHVHDGARPVQDEICHVCGKTYDRRILKHHMLIHSSERTYVCNICGATFKQGAALYNHNKLKHKKKRRERRQPAPKL